MVVVMTGFITCENIVIITKIGQTIPGLTSRLL